MKKISLLRKSLCWQMNLIIVVLVILSLNLTAQVSPNSLVVSNLYAITNTMEPENVETNASSEKVTIGFKANIPAIIDEIHILVGSSKDSSDFRSFTLNVITANGESAIYLNSQKLSRFWSEDAIYEFAIPSADFHKLKWVTLYCKDKSGVISNRAYFNVQ